MSPLQARVNLRPWPYAPRPFGDEAFGSWFGRVASRYRMTVEMAWEINGLGPLPALTSVGWILFSPLDESALEKVAARARRRCDHCKHSDAGLMDGGEKAIAFLLSMPRDQPDGCERAILEAGVAEPGHHVARAAQH